MTSSYPSYLKRDIGHLFYVYDFKFSGEHRVRLVFDGSRQGASTYSETYAPTARQESMRLFHIVAVEESYGIGQYDVPQAFLKAFIDHDILDSSLWSEFKNQKCKTNISDFKIHPNLSKYLLIAWKGTNLERCYMSPKFLANYDSNCNNIS